MFFETLLCSSVPGGPRLTPCPASHAHWSGPLVTSGRPLAPCSEPAPLLQPECLPSLGSSSAATAAPSQAPLGAPHTGSLGLSPRTLTLTPSSSHPGPGCQDPELPAAALRPQHPQKRIRKPATSRHLHEAAPARATGTTS